MKIVPGSRPDAGAAVRSQDSANFSASLSADSGIRQLNIMQQ